MRSGGMAPLAARAGGRRAGGRAASADPGAARRADLVAVSEGSSEALVAGLARELAAAQARRASNSVGARFRDQLRDLIARLDRCGAAPLVPGPLKPPWLPCC